MNTTSSFTITPSYTCGVCGEHFDTPLLFGDMCHQFKMCPECSGTEIRTNHVIIPANIYKEIEQLAYAHLRANFDNTPDTGEGWWQRYHIIETAKSLNLPTQELEGDI